MRAPEELRGQKGGSRSKEISDPRERERQREGGTHGRHLRRNLISWNRRACNPHGLRKWRDTIRRVFSWLGGGIKGWQCIGSEAKAKIMKKTSRKVSGTMW